MKPFKLLNCIFQKTLIMVTILILFPIQGISQSEQKKEPSLKGKNIICVYGGWKGHKPNEKADLIVKILRAEGANVKVFHKLSVYTDEKLMAETDLIVRFGPMEK